MWYQWLTWLMTCDTAFLDETGEPPFIAWASVQ